MPTKTNVPTGFWIGVQGQSMDLSDYFTDKSENLQSAPVCSIGRSDGIYIGPICQDEKIIRDALESRLPLVLRPPNLVLFGKQLWNLTKAEQACDNDQLRLLILEAGDKERDKWERLRRKFSGVAGKPVECDRKPIPQSVRIFVWRRDQGKCVQCGSNQKLEYDHILPVSKGGSNTERNVQLLCEKCNRAKSDKI